MSVCSEIKIPTAGKLVTSTAREIVHLRLMLAVRSYRSLISAPVRHHILRAFHESVLTQPLRLPPVNNFIPTLNHMEIDFETRISFRWRVRHEIPVHHPSRLLNPLHFTHFSYITFSSPSIQSSSAVRTSGFHFILLCGLNGKKRLWSVFFRRKGME